METAVTVGNFGKFFRLTRSASGKAQPLPPMLPDGSGHLISGCERKLQRRVGHLGQLLNRPPIQSIHVTLPGDVEQHEIDLESPTNWKLPQSPRKRSHPVRMAPHLGSSNLVFQLC